MQQKSMLAGWMDGQMNGWMGGWMGQKAVLRIAYNNKKDMAQKGPSTFNIHREKNVQEKGEKR